MTVSLDVGGWAVDVGIWRLLWSEGMQAMCEWIGGCAMCGVGEVGFGAYLEFTVYVGGGIVGLSADSRCGVCRLVMLIDSSESVCCWVQLACGRCSVGLDR